MKNNGEKNKKKKTFIHGELWMTQHVFEGFLCLGRELDLRYLADWNISLSICCEVSFKCFSVFTIQAVIS